jgi:hypothetical protein
MKFFGAWRPRAWRGRSLLVGEIVVRRHKLFVWMAALLAVSAPAADAGTLLLSGRVVDENETPLAGARIAISTAFGGPPIAEAISSPDGKFHVNLPQPGSYLVGVRRTGFFELRGRALTLDGPRDLVLVLSPVREVIESLDVEGTPSPIDVEQTQREQTLSTTEIAGAPYPSSHSLRNAMRLMPQVVQDPTGSLHFAGGAEYQTLYTLNGFDIGDPVTGRFNTRLPLEAARSLEFSTGRFSPEFGKGSAGALAITTQSGDDTLRYLATNFIPGVNTNNGIYMGGWTPRFGLYGPIRKGRAWFADNLDLEYDNAFLNGLPKGENHRYGFSGSNLLHTQINLTPSQILFTDVLVNTDNQFHSGLGALDPLSTTTTLRSSEYFWSARDQIYFGHGTLLEVGFAQNRFSLRRIPQGGAPYLISPEGRTGNYFVHSAQNARRDQFLAALYLPRHRNHQIKMGTGADRLSYSAQFQRTEYLRLGLDGQPLSQTVFQGLGRFSRPNLELSSYILDDWRIHEHLNLELGLRQDWDELIRRAVLSPRISASWSPFGATRISGGYAITYDASNLNLFSQPLDQQSVTYLFSPDGSITGSPPTQYIVPYGRLRVPQSSNWSATIGRRFPHRLDVSLDYLLRRGVRGFTYLPDITGANVLSNERRDRYQSAQISLRQSLRGQFAWSLAYTRSQTVSNSVLDLSVDQVYRVLNNFGPMPWDSPHRLIAYAYMPLPRKNWAIAMMAEGRSGYPFSIQDFSGKIVGQVNDQRYPFNFEMNIHLERMFTLHGYRFALRGGFNNITNSGNPTAVNNTTGSPRFLQFFGQEGRHFQARIRLFGRA